MKRWRGVCILLICIASLLMFLLIIEIRWYKKDFYRIDSQIVELDKQFNHKMFNWTNYLEKRVNGLAQSQDEYQISTSRRMEILEERIKRLENKHDNKNK
jgi:hypothetical protein